MKEKIFIISDRCVEFFLYAMIFFIPISTAAIEICFSFAFLFFIIKKSIKPDFNFLDEPSHIFLFIFIFFTAASVFNSSVHLIQGADYFFDKKIYFKHSFTGLFSKWFEAFFLYLMTQDLFRKRKRVRNAIIILLTTSALVAVDGLFQQYAGIEFLRHRVRDFPGVSASFSHYNDFGTYLVCILAILMGIMLQPNNRTVSVVAQTLLIALLVGVLLLTLSRGAWLAFALGAVFVLYFSRKFNKITWVLFLFVICLFVFIPFREKLFYTLSPSGDSQRLDIWATTLKLSLMHPLLGLGTNTFMDKLIEYNLYHPGLPAAYAHNCYLQIFAESGIFALVSFLAFIMIIFKRGVMAFALSRDFMLLGILGAIFCFLVNSFFDTALYSLQLSIMFWILLGLLQALSSLNCSEKTMISK